MSKLYARIAGDKASGQHIEKGQGGQSYVRLDLYNEARQRIACLVARYDKEDGEGATTIELTATDDTNGRIEQRHVIRIGEKQKGEHPQG